MAGDRHLRIALLAALLVSLTAASAARAQSFGPLLQNTMMPASGGMGGVSIARPQDLVSAINANPATLTNYKGTEFILGGGWAEPTMHLDQTRALPLAGVTPFSAKSRTPGDPITNIGVSQQVDLFGVDSTTGIGLISEAGGGVDFRGVPQSNGTSSQSLILEINAGTGLQVTDRLSVGAGIQLGSAFFDGPFVGIGAMVPDYALRGSVGAAYQLTNATTLGAYYQSKQHFNFQQAIEIQTGPGIFTGPQNIHMDLPRTVGLGIANRSLAQGRMLLGMDVLFLDWQDTDLFGTIYRNQWVFQFGSQYSVGRLRLRAGYVFAENPLKTVTVTTPGGVTLPDGIPAVNYLQSQMAVMNNNRITGGFGIVDVRPGIDFDFFAGGMFRQTAQLGDFTSVSVASYWAGLGITWRPGAGRCNCRYSK